jgi:hypothetical protein
MPSPVPGTGLNGSLLVDGLLVGTWRILLKAGRAKLVVRPTVTLTAADICDVEAEGQRLVAFTDADAAYHFDVIRPG